MARMPNLDKMSVADLMALRNDVDEAIAQRQTSDKAALREQMASLARAQGFELSDIVGGGKRSRTPVAIKYRDPENAANTWTGRGRMPRWMVAATKRRGVKKEDFLI